MNNIGIDINMPINICFFVELISFFGLSIFTYISFRKGNIYINPKKIDSRNFSPKSIKNSIFNLFDLFFMNKK